MIYDSLERVKILLRSFVSKIERRHRDNGSMDSCFTILGQPRKVTASDLYEYFRCIPTGASTILKKVFRAFPQCSWPNAGILSQT
jgi:hypothetical protein